MRYNTIRKMDISNGEGVRVSIFMQGCPFHCKNCFNPETHDFNGGKEFTDKTVSRILKLCEKDYIKGLSILGGEPMCPTNIQGTVRLASAFKEKFPTKTVWVWTGYLFETLDKQYLTNIDVLVDGQYVEELHSPLLLWRGSSNQRVTDVQASLKLDEVKEIEYEDRKPTNWRE